jgi:hypothetical protein
LRVFGYLDMAIPSSTEYKLDDRSDIIYTRSNKRFHRLCKAKLKSLEFRKEVPIECEAEREWLVLYFGLVNEIK